MFERVQKRMVGTKQVEKRSEENIEWMRVKKGDERDNEKERKEGWKNERRTNHKCSII